MTNLGIFKIFYDFFGNKIQYFLYMTYNEDNKIGIGIKKVLKETNLTQQDIAEILDMTQSAISRWLNGKPFGKNAAKQWEEAFGFRQNWLLTGEGDMFTSDHPKIFDYKKGGDNYGNVTANRGSAAGTINGNPDMRTFNAEKIIKPDGTIELHGGAQDVIDRLEYENKALLQRISDLETLLATKDALINSLREQISILKDVHRKQD